MKGSSIEVTQLTNLPERKPDSHKGNYGRILVIAGSTGMAGAGALTAMAALRAGAGLVTMLVPARIYEIAAGFSPCVMVRPSEKCRDYFTIEAVKEVTELLHGIDVVAMGPGLGRDEETQKFVRETIKIMAETRLVLDADGLYGVRTGLETLTQRKAETVITPHPGECSYLLGASTESIQADRIEAAKRLARAAGAVAVLKGHRSVTTDGNRYYINPTGNAGMATAGSGDVLTGVIAALMAQGMTAFEAACLGTCLHGIAGDLAAEEVGQQSVVATDLIGYLPEAFASRK